MNRKFNMSEDIYLYTLRNPECLPSGTMEAARIVTAYMHYNIPNDVCTEEDFYEAVRVLASYVAQNKVDVVPERYYCEDADCKFLDYPEFFCPAQMQLGKNSKKEKGLVLKKCPYYHYD